MAEFFLCKWEYSTQVINMQNFRTDLAMEVCEGISNIDGVEIRTQATEETTLTWVEIRTQAGVETMGRPVGNYITLESQLMKENAPAAHETIVTMLAEKLGALHKLPSDATVLVIGLGNRYVTPDALGPKVCEKLLVTRHLNGEVPIELEGTLRGVAAIAPGVMGITGIETAEIARGIVDKINPDLVIAIDALAARKTSRINATIQIADVGVNPGAGMGNQRTPINQSTMGVPVIAIGVPTVVDAATLVNDTMGKMLQEIAEANPFYNMLDTMEEGERYGLITEILDPYTENMFVTPKEVDAVIERLAKIIADAINIAMHPGVSKEDMGLYI